MNTKLNDILAIVFVCTVFISLSTKISAATRPVQTKLISSQDKVKNKSPYHVDIFLDTKGEHKLSGVTAVIKYPPALEYNEKESSKPSKECENSNYKLNQTLNIKDDKKAGILTITRVLIDRDENLPSGYFCFGTVAFTSKLSGFWSFLPWVNSSGTVALGDASMWEIVGPGEKFVAEPDTNASSVKITVTH